MGLKPGYLVTKQVRLVRQLKRGGMGSVWVADHLGLKSQVAVKFMSGKVAEDPAMVTRFAREATSAAQVKSPHVVQVHDHGVTEAGEPYIVMELLEGEDLAALLRRKETLPLEQIGAIVTQTCRVLRKAHDLGIVHRDIKPSNIFVVEAADEELFVKVLDFGVAKHRADESDITTTGATVGTMVYMAPEQLLSARSVDHRADLWSLAVVVYRSITGDLPFRDDDGVGALVRALDLALFRPASQVVEGLPPAVDAWLTRAFQRDAGDRFASAREFADEFMIAIGRDAAVAQSQVSSATGQALKRVKRAVYDGPTESVNRPISATQASKVGKAQPTGAGKRVAAPRGDASGADVVQAETLAGTATLAERTRPKAKRARALGVAIGLSILGVGAAVTYAVAPQLFNAAKRAPAPAASGDASTSPPPTPTPPTPPTAATPAPPVAPALTATPSGTPATADAAPSAAASASATASAKSPARGGATPRGGRGVPRPEKDYGF